VRSVRDRTGHGSREVNVTPRCGIARYGSGPGRV